MASDVELAYIAGLIDGEGSLSLNRNKKYFKPCMRIANTYRPVLEWVRERIGGKVYIRVRKNPKHKTLFVHYLQCKELQAFLPIITPYLIIKFPQALLIADYLQYSKDLSTRGTDIRQETMDGFKQTLTGLNKCGT